MFKIEFTDRVILDSESRTVISIRDGIQKYSGAELSMEPPDKIFTIFRGPETIRAAAGEMTGLPMTDEHVSLDAVPVDVIGKVINARIIDHIDEETSTTVKVRNDIELNGDVGKRELSLGYHADLIPCDLYDFEQVDIVPHHLAIVARGRCGKTCTFSDEATMKKTVKANALFLDAAGEINMQQVLQLVADLPEVVKTLPLKELQKLAQLLTKAMDVATAEIATEAAAEVTAPAAGEDEPPIETSVEVEDENDPPEETKTVPTADSEVDFKDSTEFTDAVAQANKTYAVVVAKARDFLPATYNFADRSVNEIMTAALATQHKDKFEDVELSTAFKLLRKNISYKNFGDSATDFVTDYQDKEL